MVILADVAVAPSAFPLGSLLVDDVAARVEFERVAETAAPYRQYFWITSERSDELPARIRSLEEVADASSHGTVDGSTLVRVRWRRDSRGSFAELLVDRDIVVLEAMGTERQWSLRLRSPDDGSLRELYDDCTAADIRFEIEQLHSTPNPDRRRAMTDKQYKAVTAAFEAGFFDVPRQASLDELAAEFGISEQALSKLIRRGIQTLLAEHLSGSTVSSVE